MLGPAEDLKAAIIAAIPRNVDDPKFYEKLCVVNEVLLELMLLMQKRYQEDIAKLTQERDHARFYVEKYKRDRERAEAIEMDLEHCRAARDAYSTQVDAYRKWEQRISKG